MSSTPEQYGFDHPSHSSLEARVRAALAGRYAVERRIGSGGMATVYLAEDARHQRQVAVKVLRVELASALGSERFLREIRIAAKLQHPHILPLLDSGEADGLLYYVMPFVQGESLRQRLQREGSLSIPDAVRILRDVTDALAYAHAQNVVHRDVKPDNIMLSGRHAVLMDFGVAKAVSQAAQQGGASTLTTRGLSIGTPAYMAPEQALADPHLDHRVDVYAAGVVAYELLAGVLPFDATTPEAMLSAQVTQKPLPLTGRREEIPTALADLVMRCLEKKREDRWQSAEVLVQQLESLATPSGGTQSVVGVKRSRSWIYFGAAAAVVAGTTLWVLERTRTNGSVVTATSRQLTFSGRAYAAAISPDGQYLAYTEDSAFPVQRLLVQEVMGGQPIERGTGIYGPELHWSGDGKNVLVYEGPDTAFSTWVVPVIGGAPRRLSRHYALESPDGRRVAEGFDSLGNAVLLRDLDTEFSETLTVHFRPSQTGTWAWSPTGRAIAFLVPQKESASIESMTVDGKDTRVLIGPETTPLAFTWVSGAIYYLRRNGTAVQLWKVPVSSETGMARGRPALIIPALDRGNGLFQSGSSEFSIAADGSRLVYIRAVPRGNLFAFSVRPGSEIAPTARQLTTGTRTIGGMHLSPDGGRVLFAAGAVGSTDIFAMPLDGGPAVQLTLMTFRTGANFAWSPDGKQIAFCAEDGTGWHVWTMAALGGTPRKLAHTRAVPWCYIAWGPAQRLIYIGTGTHSGPNGGHPRVLDLATEQEQALVQDDSLGYMNAPQISPDGKQVAVYWERPDREGLWMLSLVDSAQQFLTAGAVVPMRWSARGDAIYAYRGHDVLRVPTAGGVASVVARLPPDWTCLDQDISPDGGRLVCSRDETQRDAWMIENFDPDVPAAKP